MTENTPKRRTAATDADIAAATIGGARRHGGPIHLSESKPEWPALFAREAARIKHALGSAAKAIEHVGSTSVPGLAAKPIIDIVVVVANSSDEPSYVAALEANGYELRIREPDWWDHRMLIGRDADVNLHVFTVGCPEVDRMLRFRDHLRANRSDREFYEATKRQLASHEWEYVQNYADAKSNVIEAILARAGKRTN